MGGRQRAGRQYVIGSLGELPRARSGAPTDRCRTESASMSGQHAAGHDEGRDAYLTRRTRALESMLVEKGLVPAGLVDQLNARFEQVAGPHNGAKAVAR